MTMSEGRMPLACVPGAIPAEERAGHFELIQRLFREARERRLIENGYAFRFGSSALVDIARFTENERRCCPFLAFVIEQEPMGGPLWLRLTGPAGTREFLEAELRL